MINEIPLNDYPRPQMVRDSFINLNGQWDFTVTGKDEVPKDYEYKIIVPYSPETSLSTVSREIKPQEFMWYRKEFEIPEDFNKGRILINFGAVDQTAEVYINNNLVITHTGGYLPFAADITRFLNGNENTILVKATDLSDTSYHARGKQKINRGGIWYTPQSGIWQTVWLESVPEKYIENIKITPVFDENEVAMTVFTNEGGTCTLLIEGESYEFSSNKEYKVKLKTNRPWSPEMPELYEIKVLFFSDKIKSYFGMRKISIGLDKKGIKRIFLNNKPYFQVGVLDQGYYDGGMYTPKDDEAVIFDIMSAKKLGFNMIRKHIKIEPMRFYYHCDRIGMLVWQDMVNGGEKYNFLTISTPLFTKLNLNDNNYTRFGRENENSRREYMDETRKTVSLLYNSPCVIMWVLFNEGWGQFDAAKAYEDVKKLDDTRLIDHASGWHDQEIGEIKSLHVYFVPYKFKKDKQNRAVVLSEFGGYNFAEGNEKNFGYKKIKSKDELKAAMKKLIEKEIIPAKDKGLCACVYTQLTDVEDEKNGLVTFDRSIIKVPYEEMKKIFSPLHD